MKKDITFERLRHFENEIAGIWGAAERDGRSHQWILARKAEVYKRAKLPQWAQHRLFAYGEAFLAAAHQWALAHVWSFEDRVCNDWNTLPDFVKESIRREDEKAKLITVWRQGVTFSPGYVRILAEMKVFSE